MNPVRGLDLAWTGRSAFGIGLALRLGVVRAVGCIELELHGVDYLPQFRAGQEPEFNLRDGIDVRLVLYQTAFRVERGDEGAKAFHLHGVPLPDEGLHGTDQSVEHVPCQTVVYSRYRRDLLAQVIERDYCRPVGDDYILLRLCLVKAEGFLYSSDS